MLEMLQQMTRSELAEVFAVLEEPPGPPEEAVRALAGTPWIFRWGPGDPERFVLVRAAQALGMGRELQQRRWTNPALERRVYAALCAQAWDGAGPETRASLLTRLTESPPQSALPELPMEARQAAALRARLATSDGLRAFASQPETLRLAPQFDATRPTPLAFLAGILSDGPFVRHWPPRPTEWSRLRRGLNLRALYQVLTLCWRARQRLLLEQRAEAARLDAEIQRVLHRLQHRPEETEPERRALPWYQRPGSPLAIAGGAGAAALTQLLLLGEPHPFVFLFGLGCAGSALFLRAPGAAWQPERRALLAELSNLRRQRLAAQRRIAFLEH